MRVSRSTEKQISETVRASISFPAEDYAELERLASTMKVSLAWVVRQATEQYLAKQHRGSTLHKKLS